jgi:hypothetical protein
MLRPPGYTSEDVEWAKPIKFDVEILDGTDDDEVDDDSEEEFGSTHRRKRKRT